MAQIKYFGEISELTGKKEEFIDAAWIFTLLKAIRDEYGEEVYKAAKTSHIFVNGENAGLKGGFIMKLRSSDVVQILPVTCGG